MDRPASGRINPDVALTLPPAGDIAQIGAHVAELEDLVVERTEPVIAEPVAARLPAGVPGVGDRHEHSGRVFVERSMCSGASYVAL